MLIKTHIVITIFLIMILNFQLNFLFVFIVILSTFLPDIDSRFSKLGKRKIFRLLQFFAGHRKIFHSFIFLGLICLPLFFISKNIFYGFFIGYGLHLFVDCFSVMGIKPFYPFEYKIKGFIRTGSFLESVLFYGFLLGDMFFFTNYFLNI
jgi:membrane-bound metal-dependent hydrolase YbcI (DUF457 family)